MRRSLFTTDHKIIGLQYFWLSLIAVLIGIVLSLLMRFHLVNPNASFAWSGAPGGVMTPEFYLSLMTIHGTLMIFFVLSVTPQSAFGNYFLPLQIGSREMAFPRLTRLSFWLTVLALLVLLAAFFVPGGAPLSGWTAYPPLSAVGGAAGPGQGLGQTLWIVSIAIFCVASVLGAINFIATTLDLRAPGVRMMQLPLTCWNWFVTAILSLMGFPVLLAAGILLLLDRSAGANFFVPGHLLISDQAIAHQGGSPLLWQHLFWFFGHPEVYIAILPGMGLISEVIATFSRKSIFGYRTMVAATFAIGFLGLLVWGHHMFVSGMSPYSSIAFSVLSMTIAVPSAVETFNWIATLWGGRIELTTAMLFALGFVSVFVTGGLSGLFLGQPVLDLYFHDTYFVVAHFHLIMGVAAILGIFAAIFYWFPRMFGRILNERLGKLHFIGTLIGVYALFVPMHLAGIAGNPRRYADFTNFEFLGPLIPLHQFMTWAAYFTALVQTLFLVNLFWSMRRGPLAPANPWCANTLEWKAAGNSALVEDPKPPALTGLIALLAAITMFFAALSSAYIVRRGISNDWVHLPLPAAVWISPLLLILGGAALEWARTRQSVLCSWVAAAAGILFIAAQMFAWEQFRHAGVTIATNPAASFFYVLSAAMTICVAGGVIASIYHRKVASYFWRYLVGLWTYLLILCYLWG